MTGLNKTVTLAGDVGQIPLFGLGTWLSEGNDCEDAVYEALSNGYRLIDTAQMYQNEDQVGAATRRFLNDNPDTKRSELFFVTKIQPDNHGSANTESSFEESLSKLQLEYIDLVLIHTPRGGKLRETYATLLRLQDEGKIKAVGVSNFGAQQIDTMCNGDANNKLRLPAVNQIELHVFLQQKPTVAYCNKNNIVVMGFCPLARCKRFGATKLTEIASSLEVPEARVMLAWSFSKGIVTIGKTANPKRIIENAKAVDLELSDRVMGELDVLDSGFKASSAVNAMVEECSM